MSLPELSIRQHVLAYMASGLLILFGIIGFRDIGVDRFPNIDLPIVSITTIEMGANPSVIDASVTNIIERAVNSVPGIDYVRSSSTPSASVVVITFDLSKDVDVAFNEVQAKVNQVLDQLPDDADPPKVAKLETNANPIIWLALSGDRTLQQLNIYADTVLRKQFENISGVGEVRLGGERRRTIRIEADPAKLASYGLTVQDLLGALNSQHLLLPGGFLTGARVESLLKLDLEYHDPRELAGMVIRYRDGANILLKDVANVVDGIGDFREIARYNGKPTVGLGIIKVTGSNSVAIINEVKRVVTEDVVPELPAGMSLEISTDDSVFIMEMVGALQEHLFLGTLLASIIVWVFLRNITSTIIIALAIPVSLLGAVALMYFFGYTFNSITLLSLLLLVGVVVDDAIVVLENIYRHLEEHPDKAPDVAAREGTHEVMFAVLAATLSLVSIFLPVVFMGGIIGRFFESFAVVVVCGVMVSWFVALSLTPMLCSRYLKVSSDENALYRIFEAFLVAIESAYCRMLGLALRFRWLTVGIAVLIFFSSFFFIQRLESEFIPEEDAGRFMVIVKAPLGSSLEYTNSKMLEVEKIIASHPENVGVFSAIGLGSQGQVNQGMSFVTMTPREERDIKQQEMIAILRQEMRSVPGAQVFTMEQPAMGGQRGESLQFALRGSNLDQVGKYAQQLYDRLIDEPSIASIDLDLQLDMPQMSLKIDRQRAAAVGLNAADIGQSVNLLAGGLDVGRYNDDPGDGERYDVRIKGAGMAFGVPDDLRKIYVRGANGDMIRVDTVAEFIEGVGPARIDRHDLQYAALFYSNPVSLGAAQSALYAASSELLGPGYSIEMIGQAKEFDKTVGYMLFAVTVAILLLYMVLASQFNSFIQPLLVMSALPLAVVGGVMALWVSDHSLNIFSMIGMLLLVGLVAKTSILLVDITNQKRAQGMSVDEALKVACPLRLRPVLMTALTVVLAMLPASLGLSAGADTNGPLSVAVIGGMISSTILTLVVVPAVYSLVENGLEAWARWRTSGQSNARQSSEV